MIQIKPKTEFVQDLMDSLENEEYFIRKCSTIEEINCKAELLLKELEYLKKRKLEQGFDISEDMANLKYKLRVLNEVKQKIIDLEKIYNFIKAS